MKKLFIVLALLSTLIACKTNCPDFDRGKLAWTPYQTNDTITLRNGDRTIRFMTGIYAHHTNSLGFLSKCECDNSWGIIAKSDSISLRIEGNLYANSDNYEYLYLSTEKWNVYSKSTSQDNYVFEGQTYENVKIYEFNETIKQVIFAKNFGLLTIIMKDGTVWTNAKIENLKDKLKSLKIETSSC